MKRSSGLKINLQHLFENPFRDIFGVSEDGEEHVDNYYARLYTPFADDLEVIGKGDGYADDYYDRFILDEDDDATNPKGAKRLVMNIHSNLILAYLCPNSRSYNHLLGEIGDAIKGLRRYLDITDDNKCGNMNARFRIIEAWDTLYDQSIKKVLSEVIDSRLQTQRRMGNRGNIRDIVKEILGIPYTSPWCLDDFLTANVPKGKNQDQSVKRRRGREDRRQRWEEFKVWVENYLLSKISENI